MNDMSTDSLRGSALARSLAILEVVAASEHPVSLAEVSALLDLPRQSVHRLLGQLVDTGMLRRDPEREHYAIGERSVDFGLTALRANARSGPVDAILRRLVADIGETCNLGILDRDLVLYIHRVECDWPLRMRLGPGSRVSLHATALGKLFMAWQPARTRRRLICEPLEAFTANTVTDIAELDRQFGLIRQRGYSLNNEENMEGLIGIAVPVFGEDGKPVAGLSVHAPVFRLPIGRAQEHFRRLRSAADDLQGYYADLKGDRKDERNDD